MEIVSYERKEKENDFKFISLKKVSESKIKFEIFIFLRPKSLKIFKRKCDVLVQDMLVLFAFLCGYPLFSKD